MKEGIVYQGKEVKINFKKMEEGVDHLPIVYAEGKRKEM